MNVSLRTCLLCTLLPLLLVSCGKQEGYEIRGDKVIWHSWRGDGLFGNWSESEMVEAAGFTILEPYQDPCPGYAKNAHHVFCGPSIMQGAEVATFQVMDKWNSLTKDAKHVYYRYTAIEGADAATFERADNVWRDKADYYYRGSIPLHVRDWANFKVLNEKDSSKDDVIWAHDKLDYYVEAKATPIADITSFQVIQSCYAKDAKQVYFGAGVLAGADAATFQGCGGLHGELAKDAKQVYWEGKVVEGCDAASFEYLRLHFAKDRQHAYFCYSSGSPPKILPGSEAKTFEVIGVASEDFGYAKDAKQVYRGGNIVPGADPATFVVDANDTENASDKHRRYRYGEPVP